MFVVLTVTFEKKIKTVFVGIPRNQEKDVKRTDAFETVLLS
jgi:hypothetical protein